VQALFGIFIATAVVAGQWVPLYAYIFLDVNVSVSEHGSLLLTLSNAWVAVLMTLVMAMWYTLLDNDYDWSTMVYAIPILLTALSTSIMVWFMYRTSLAQHYDWFKTRPHRQWKLLLRRATPWVGTAISMGDAFMLAFVPAAVLNYHGGPAMGLYQVLFWGGSILCHALLGGLLSSKAGLRYGVKTMYIVMFLPGLNTFTTMLCIMFGSTAWVYVAAVVLMAGAVQNSTMGLLVLQTVPTRECFAAMQQVMVLLGSVCMALGGMAGAGIVVSLGLGGGKLWFLVTTGVWELIRVGLASTFISCHRKENLAIP
jgi:hypothetical protein